MDFTIAVSSLNQWALDFEGNTKRVIESIEEAHANHAIYRTGPELELCGYSLEDAFFENDTGYHCWQSLKVILDSTKHLPVICDIGMPVHFGSLYNCRVICHRGRILCIRAKTSLAKEGIYREFRHFNAWPLSAGVVPFRLPPLVVPVGQSEYVPFGADFVLDLVMKKNKRENTLRLGWEICQELWDINNVSADLYDKYGCHVVINSSGSYWELRKLDTVNDMIRSISLRAGACYLYSNLFGCDGQRYVFSGRSCVYDRGCLKQIMPVQSDLLAKEIHSIIYNVNPSTIDEHRAQCGIRPNLGAVAALNSGLKVWNLSSESKVADASKIDSSYKVLQLKIDQSERATYTTLAPSVPVEIKFQEEINIYVSLWLWDYLRRSGMKGFMMPLSGGLDSSTVAMLVFGMCKLLRDNSIHDREINIIESYFQKCHDINPSALKLMSARDICHLLLKCTYISTKYSGQQTESRARKLCQAIGAEYSTVSIQDVYEQCRQKDLGTRSSDQEVTLLDQNLQARLRMTMTYYLSGGNRIVLATGNVDEGIMGYLTKYDCSSADLNPIGGLCKDDLKSYLKYCCGLYGESDPDLNEVLAEIIDAPPSAELTGSEQRDEDEIGITYAEISVLGKVRRGVYGCCGPKGAFECVWRNRGVPPFSTHIRCLQERRPEHSHARPLGELILGVLYVPIAI